MSTIHDLTTAITAVCPIDGISGAGPNIPNDQWIVWYNETATPEQIAAAQVVIAAFDWNANKAAGQARYVAINADTDRKDLHTQLQSATPAQIEAYVRGKINANGVVDLTSAKTFAIRMETFAVMVTKYLMVSGPL